MTSGLEMEWTYSYNHSTHKSHQINEDLSKVSTHTHTTVLWHFFRDHPGELVPEENFCTLWCKGKLTEADSPTIRLGATTAGLSSAHLHHPPCFLISTKCQLMSHKKTTLLLSTTTAVIASTVDHYYHNVRYLVGSTTHLVSQ